MSVTAEASLCFGGAPRHCAIWELVGEAWASFVIGGGIKFTEVQEC